MDFWEWVTASIPAGAVVNGLGLGALAILFASDRIQTRGQGTRALAKADKAHDDLTTALKDSHKAAIAELVKHHTELIAEKERIFLEMRDSRNYYREARLEERARAEQVTDKLAETVDEYAKLTNHILSSVTETDAK